MTGDVRCVPIHAKQKCETCKFPYRLEGRWPPDTVATKSPRHPQQTRGKTLKFSVKACTKLHFFQYHTNTNVHTGINSKKKKKDFDHIEETCKQNFEQISSH